MIDVVILFFLLGLVAGLLKSNLRLPSAVYDLLSALLLLAIGLKGGQELASQHFSVLLPQIVAVAMMGFLLPLLVFPILLKIGKFRRVDAASIAAHYGSVSVGTFAVVVSFLEARQVFFEEHMSLFVVILEIPAIIVGIVLARGLDRSMNWKKFAHEVFLGKSIVFLVGGLIIGCLAGQKGLESIGPLFFNPFKGILALFLMEMGLVVASQFASLKKYGTFLLVFGIVTPLFFSLIGIYLGFLLGLSIGGVTVLGTLAASASYIAVPAAMRTSVPSSNPTLSLTASLGVTFPFNVVLGIPIYYFLAEKLKLILEGF
ncbi:sodium-dependent bicarbonate transport family permease [bacterium]|nr:sodium-dependent bicarbonate transport family permease [bacterium]